MKMFSIKLQMCSLIVTEIIRSLSELTFMGTQSKLQSFLVTTWIVTMRIHAEFLLPFSSAFTGKPRH
jgi:hypothetical protein